jgi:hypothetical protein
MIKIYGNGTQRYSLGFRREDMGGPAHPWGRGGRGGGSVQGRVSKTSSGREAFIKIISRTFFLLSPRN